MSSGRWLKIGRNGRRPQKLNKIPFKEEWKMALNNQVSTKKEKSSDVPCLKETFAFITCLKDNNNSHEICRAQGESVTKCFEHYMTEKARFKQLKQKAGDFVPSMSVKDMEPVQLNRFLSHFPHKLKKN